MFSFDTGSFVEPKLESGWGIVEFVMKSPAEADEGYYY